MKLNTIYNESCLDTINRMPDEFLDCIITSPPYYAGKEYEDLIKTKEGYQKYLSFLLEVFQKSIRTLKKGGHLWINIDDVHTSLKSVWKVNKVLPTHAFLIQELSQLLDYKEMILWKKIRGKHSSGGANRLLGSYGRFRSPGSIPIVQEVEYILWFKKAGVRNDLTDEKRKKSALLPEEFSLYGMQIWEIKPERAKKIGHPAPFPLEIPNRIIKLSSFENDIIYDPFMGSGSTAISSFVLHRNYIGSELDTKYYKLAEQRIQPYKTMRQLTVSE